jgi:hypothetical protein
MMILIMIMITMLMMMITIPSGLVDFYSSLEEGDQHGALASEAGVGLDGREAVIRVTAMTLDGHLASIRYDFVPIFLLKVGGRRTRMTRRLMMMVMMVMMMMMMR